MPNDTSPKLLWAIMTLYWSITGAAAKILPAMSAPMVANTMSSTRAASGVVSQDRRWPVQVATDFVRRVLRDRRLGPARPGWAAGVEGPAGFEGPAGVES